MEQHAPQTYRIIASRGSFVLFNIARKLHMRGFLAVLNKKKLPRDAIYLEMMVLVARNPGR